METTLVPAPDPSLEALWAPVVEVTVLEDRARVTRRGMIRLEAGHHKLVVREVAPVLQDASLRGAVEAGSARMPDVRVRRALKILQRDKPQDIAALDEAIAAVMEKHALNEASGRRARARLETVQQMLGRWSEELPGDVGWGAVDEPGWRETAETLFGRRRGLQKALDVSAFEASDLARELGALIDARRLGASSDRAVVAWVELDVAVEEEGEVAISLEYTVPNAMWRPSHTARLEESRLIFTSRAAVWQNTGEDWEGARLIFSTARPSQNTEPPLLYDDLLKVRPSSDQIVVEAREVRIQKASLEASSSSVSEAAPSGVTLPGVDDGGEVQSLHSELPITIPSDGRPCFVTLGSFEAAARVDLMAMPEMAGCVFRRSVQTHPGPAPLLAGPVSLLHGGELIGTSEVGYVAAGERFELCFGALDDLRLSRVERHISDKIDSVDKWRRRITTVHVYLSNLGPEERVVKIIERLPVSEVEHARVRILEKHTTVVPTPDRNGFCKWKLKLTGHQHTLLRLTWELSLAPGVQMP